MNGECGVCGAVMVVVVVVGWGRGCADAYTCCVRDSVEGLSAAHINPAKHKAVKV